MIPVIKLKQIMLRYFAESRWYTIAGGSLFYAATSYVFLLLAGENALTHHTNFIYWLAVTASTVGYGDLSPQSSAGKLVVAFYVIPVGLTLFAMVIGRIAAWVSEQWKKGLNGMRSLNLQNHILVIGWNDQRTLMLVNLLLKERQATSEQPEIVLCVKAHIENPLPGKIEFVHVESFNKDDDMDRACVDSASVILIDNPQDDVTMTTALYCSKRNPNAHLVAYFDDESLVTLLQQHCPNVECTPSVAVEMLAKSAFDPGSSMLHHDLLSVNEGQAQYSATIPNNASTVSMERIFHNLKKQYDAIVIGYAPEGHYRNMVVNPPLDTQLNPGDRIFYIASSRISHIDWQAMA